MYNPPFTITPKILNLVGEITEVITKLKVFDKKRKRQGKEEEKKRLIKKQISPHLFLIFSLSLPHLYLILLLKLKKNFRTAFTKLENVPINDQKNDPKKRVNKILELIKENKFITIKELAHKLNVSEKTIKRDLDKLKKENILKRIGKKGGYWEIIKE